MVAALKVPGWRLPLWATGGMVVAFGIGSLGIAAVSQLATVPAILAVAWGVAFIAVGEREARRRDHPTAEVPGAKVPDVAAQA